MAKITSLSDDALIAFDALSDTASNLLNPTLRLGVTGLSRAGKTVFISALIHNLLHGGRLPLFKAHASGRLASCTLAQQPDDEVPTFQYHDHINSLVRDRVWPHSTRAISELRLVINYESASSWNRTFGAGQLNLDIVDYPGEWLLDLPLLGKSYEAWSREALSLSMLPNRKHLAKPWHEMLSSLSPGDMADEGTIKKLSDLFCKYLRSCRNDATALSTLPPGRFLMPGDLEGSPALTFAPLSVDPGQTASSDTLHAVMERRYEAYKNIVVKPFFRNHFSRMDRQIVLVDALQALNAGPEAVADLENALSEILSCFNHGKRSWLTSWFSGKTDRILFAATKADHLHHTNHPKLQAILSRLVDSAIDRAKFAGAEVDVVALAALRATREAELYQDGETLPVIVGTPIKGETIAGQTFDGETDTAIFPGDLPEDANEALSGKKDAIDLNFVRFRPPMFETNQEEISLQIPNIRLDRTLEFLLGDQLA